MLKSYHMKNYITFIFIVCLLSAFPFLAGCSQNNAKEKENKALQESERAKQELRQLHENFIKNMKQQKGDEKKETVKYEDQISIEDKEWKEKVAVVEECDKAFQKCIDKCKSDDCEQKCITDLSNCEKNVPPEYQTLKSY